VPAPSGPHKPTSPAESGPEAPRRQDGVRPAILVIDDDRLNQKLARVLLEAEGYDVRLAVDAVSALEILKTCEPALILMDIQLPGMDGWELTRRLKRNFATRDIPIVALTAYGIPSDAAHARLVGCAEYVAKPLSTEELPAIVRRHVRPAR
jgi:two-component system cell cycle response regulator DivK